jgi:hypothetical protein
LADACKSSTDFVLVRTTRGSLAEFLARYDFDALGELDATDIGWLTDERHALLVHCVAVDASPQGPTLVFHDRRARPRLELGLATKPEGAVHYVERGGVELVESPSVLRVWEPVAGDRLDERDVRDRGIRIGLRHAQPTAP